MAFLTKDTHRNTIENLSAYLDGQLGPREAAMLEAHLESCSECAWENQTLAQTRSLMAQVPVLKVPRSFTLREAQIAAPVKTGIFTSARMLYLRGVTAAVGILLSAVVAGDLWLRPLAPVPMVSAPAAAPQAEAMTFGATAVALPTADSAMKTSGQQLAADTAQPEATPPPPPAVPAPDDGVRASGGPEATPEVAAQEFTVNERGGGRTVFWADLRLWRVAEGVLGGMFIALVTITVTGWRRVARLN